MKLSDLGVGERFEVTGFTDLKGEVFSHTESGSTVRYDGRADTAWVSSGTEVTKL